MAEHDWLELAINKQRDFIEGILAAPMSKLSQICSRHWQDRFALDTSLKSFLVNKSDRHCRLLYAIDNKGIQHSSNITDQTSDDSIVGQDLSNRPYLDAINQQPSGDFILSDVYIDKQTNKPCITAIHNVSNEAGVVGYIAADFGLKDLPLKSVNENQLAEWRQIKGDPSIRSTLFQQTRTRSAMDERIDQVLGVVESLVTEQGIFHAKLHFSSSRATLWPYDDPYHYRIHVLDEIINPEVCLVYAKQPYPEDTVIPADMVPKILQSFKALREADETIYLRAASLNVMNGLVGLNFSCDGSHYMPAAEFLSKNLDFWFGKPKTACNVE